MKIAAILAALLLGTTGAVAEPDRPLDGRDRGDSWRDRGDYTLEIDPYARRTDARWVTLTAPLHNYNNREFIRVGPNAGRFERIKLDVARGTVFVRQISVEFADRTTQKVRVDQFVRAGEQIEIDVPGRARAVNRIIVYTEPARGRRSGGEYVVSAAPARTQYGMDRYTPRNYWRR